MSKGWSWADYAKCARAEAARSSRGHAGEAPLEALIRNGQLIITIGLETLAQAFADRIGIEKQNTSAGAAASVAAARPRGGSQVGPQASGKPSVPEEPMPCVQPGELPGVPDGPTPEHPAQEAAGLPAAGTAAKPATDAVATASRHLTVDQQAILLRDWDTPRPVPEILAEVIALPGWRGTERELRYHAALLFLHRPPGKGAPRLPATRDGSPSVAEQQLREEDQHLGVAEVDLNTAKTWGRRNGVPPKAGLRVSVWLARLNQCRADLGLPPFRIIAPRGPVEPLPAVNLGGAG